MTTAGSTTTSKKKRTGRVPFPKRLFELLKLCEDNGWEDMFSWVNDGTGFKVHDRAKFEKELLQKHFNTTRYASFARQLHAYGFDCVRTGRQTGIYSHPQFKRDDHVASCSLIREAAKPISKAAIYKHNKNNSQQQKANINRFSNFQLGIRAGDTVVRFPSLLNPNLQDDDNSSLRTTQTVDVTSQQPSRGVMAGLFETARNQVADRTRQALIRIPSESSDNPFMNPEKAFWDPSLHNRVISFSEFMDSTSSHMHGNTFWPPASSNHHNRTVRDTSAVMSPKITNMNMNVSYTKATDTFAQYNMNIGNALRTISDDDDDDTLDQMEFDDFEPIPWSPLNTPQDGGGAQDSIVPIQLDAILEPRLIDEMVQEPFNLNTYLYDSVPMFGTPRKRAMLEFSLPISLPFGFYLMDVSTYGLCCASFLILGHFVECLFTSWGGANDKTDKTYTKDLSVKPTIGMLQHHIMDLMWFHSLLSNMILTPTFFGPPCYALLYLFVWPQPFNLCIALKTHYCESKLEGTYAHEKWWIGDLMKNIVLGYAFTILGIFLVHCLEMEFLRIPLVFGFNMIPLIAFESYRYLLSMSAVAGLTSAAKVSKTKKVQ